MQVKKADIQINKGTLHGLTINLHNSLLWGRANIEIFKSLKQIESQHSPDILHYLVGDQKRKKLGCCF